jgi:hypothetical protein
MRKQSLWITNFVTTILMAGAFIFPALQRIFFDVNDKDVIVIFFGIVVLTYVVILAYFFYKLIVHWANPQKQSFYLTTFPVTAFCLFALISFGRIFAFQPEKLTAIEIFVAVICGLNIVTFFMGLMAKD